MIHAAILLFLDSNLPISANENDCYVSRLSGNVVVKEVSKPGDIVKLEKEKRVYKWLSKCLARHEL
jgi:hypothetical protein